MGMVDVIFWGGGGKEKQTLRGREQTRSEENKLKLKASLSEKGVDIPFEPIGAAGSRG